MYKTTAQTWFDNPNREKTAEYMQRAGASRIAIAYPVQASHIIPENESLAELKKALDFFEERGAETVVWLGQSIGHSGARTNQVGKYRHLKYNTKGNIEAICPLDENFINDYKILVKEIAKTGARMIMLDDDFRLGYRGGLGCCCDVHMKAVCDEIGEYLTVDELHEKMLSGGRNKYRDAWLNVQGNSMYNFAHELRCAVDEINKDVRLSICCSPNSWDTDGFDVTKMVKIMAGGTKPFLRLIGAPYWGKLWQNQKIGEVIEYERMEMAWMNGKDVEVFSEGDTYPRPRFATPAAYLECFDQILRADASSDGILKYMLDYFVNPDYEPGYCAAAERNRKLYEEIERLFADKQAVGVYPYTKEHILRDAELEGDNPNRVNDLQEALFSAAARLAVRNSLPTAYKGDGVKILFGEHARHIEKDELSTGCIIDIAAAKILEKRGIDTGTAEIGESKKFSHEYFPGENITAALRDEFEVYHVGHKPGARILTEYAAGDDRINGIYRYENKDGLRFFVIPVDAEAEKLRRGLFESYALRRLITANLEWLGRRKLCACLSGDFPYMYFMTKKKGNRLCVGMWNLFEDAAHGVKVNAADEIEKINYINCSGHIIDNTVILDSVIYPFEFAALEIETKGEKRHGN